MLYYLERLPPTGPNGFEGLIASLLGTLTGRHFHLASAGRQFGRDMISERYGGSVIAVECKRYGENSELNETELLGKLSQARVGVPDLDLWVLVTSRDVADQINNSLYEVALPFGIEVRIISAGDGVPSSLETLFASSPQTVIGFLEAVVSKDEREELSKRLTEISLHPNFPQTATSLKESFSEQSLGYDHWRVEQKEWLAKRFRSKDSSSAFGQPLNFAADGVKLVERKAAWKELDQWWEHWSKEKHPFALLGEEGDGKTWAIASWLGERMLAADQAPPVIFLASQQVSSNEPTDLLSRTIAAQLRSQGRDFWEKRVIRWFRKPKEDRPMLLLVLDGINERYHHEWWKKLLGQLQDPDEDQPWRDRIGLLITCRTDYWKDHFGKLRTLPVQSWILPSYDDFELQTALDGHGLSLQEIREDLLPLIRKPRLLDLVVKLRGSIAESGDITPARVIYEDWRDKCERKSAIPLDPSAFQQLIQELAARHREGLSRVRLPEVSQLLSPLGDVSTTLNELQTSGIFKRSGNDFQVDERRLTLGFGLLLAEQVKQASRETQKALDEAVAEWLEPHKEMDLKAAICGYAAYHSLVEHEFSNAARVALLKAWLNTHTPGHQAGEDFQAYLPLSPESYVGLAECVWSDKNENFWAQELLMAAFLGWRQTPKVVAAIQPAFERWLGFVHPEGYPLRRGPEGKDTEKIRAEIASRVGQSLTLGSLRLIGRSFTVINDDGLMRLARVALAVISYLPRKPYIGSIARNCIAEVMMGYPNNEDLIAWVLRSSSENLWEEIKSEVDDLLSRDHILAKQAAHRLLSYEAGPQAAEKKQTLPKGLFPPNVLWERYKKDPCASGFAWRREHCEEGVRRKDIPLRFVAGQINRFSIDPDLNAPTDFVEALESLASTIQSGVLWSNFSATMADHEFDEIELAMCAITPVELADVVRRIFDKCESHLDGALRQLSFRLVEHYPIFGSQEWNIIRSNWQKLRNRLDGASEAVKTAECFFFATLLRVLEPPEQLKQLLERPFNAIDLVSFENRFKALTNWDEFQSELQNASEDVTIRRLLWFISAHTEKIPEDVIEQVADFFMHQNGTVRSIALKIIYTAKASAGRGAVIASDWSWNAEQDPEETYWGSLILSEAPTSVPYRELRNRIHPAYLGYAVYSRGLKKDEVEQFAEDIDRIWSGLIGTAPNLPVDFPQSEMICDISVKAKSFQRIGLSRSDFSRSVKFVTREAFWGGMAQANRENIEDLLNPDTLTQQSTLIQIAREAMKEQIQAGNTWFAHQFVIEALDEVVMRRPDLVEKWLAPILRQDANASKLIVLGRSFYESVCEVLLAKMPEKGSLLYRQLDAKKAAIQFLAGGTKIPLTEYALFRSPPATMVIEDWTDRLLRCKTDRDLLELAIAAQEGRAITWLWAQVDRGLASRVLMDQARSAMLLGFVDGERAKDLLQQRLLSEPLTWIDHVVRDAWFLWQKNSWAKRHRRIKFTDWV